MLVSAFAKCVCCMSGYMSINRIKPAADLHSKILDAPGPNSLISCSFWGNLAKSYVGGPPSRGLVPPPRGNPGFATD